MNIETDTIPRNRVKSMLLKLKADNQAATEAQQVKHDEELAALRAEIEAIKQAAESSTVYNNRPQQTRNAQWQQQLAILKEGVQNKELKTLGQNSVGNYLRSKGLGANNKTAADLVSMLVTDGFLERKANGKAVYLDEPKLKLVS